jgi:hypothetical protein
MPWPSRAEYHPLRYKGEYDAEAVNKDGVALEMKPWEGMNPGCFRFAGIVDKPLRPTT